MLFKKKSNEDELGSILAPLTGIKAKLNQFINNCESGIDAERKNIEKSNQSIEDLTSQREQADKVLKSEMFKSLD